MRCPHGETAPRYKRGQVQHAELLMPNGPDPIAGTGGMFTLPSAACHRSFAVTGSGPEPRSPSCMASRPGATLTAATSLRCCGTEELPGKPGLRNKQQPLLLSRASSLQVWHFWSWTCPLPPFANQALKGIFKKKAYHVSKIRTLAIRAVIAFIKRPTLRIWKWWKDRFGHWCVPAALVSSSQCQYKEQDHDNFVASDVPLRSDWMCLYTFFLGKFVLFFFFISPLDSPAKISSRLGINFHLSLI